VCATVIAQLFLMLVSATIEQDRWLSREDLNVFSILFFWFFSSFSFFSIY